MNHPPDPLTPGDHGEYTVTRFPPKMNGSTNGARAPVVSMHSGTILHDGPIQNETAPPVGLGEWDASDDVDLPPPRAWLLGNIFCRGFMSSLLADGGVGKTALRYAQLLSLAIGRSLTGEHVFERCKVLIVSLEDDRNELKRRILAACLHYGIQPSELKGWLFLSAPGASGGKLMTVDKKGRLLRGAMADNLEAVVKARKIDIVSLDPFVKAHSVEENNNSAIDDVVQVLTDLGAKYNIAVDAPHHTSKGPADPGNASKGRGASAMNNGGRLVYTLSTMSTDEAKAFGIEEDQRRSYIRMDSAKVNITKHLGNAKWFRLIGVRLGNATEMYPNGDEVQTVQLWKPPETWSDLSSELLNKILTAIDEGLPDGDRYSSAPSAGKRAALAKQYSAQGLEMLHEHAQFEDGSVSVEAGLMDMLDRMQTGRFKVFKELNDWWEEFRLYHRKDGRVVKEGDDLMAATRYALMMLRFARTEKQRRDFHREIVYPSLGKF